MHVVKRKEMFQYYRRVPECLVAICQVPIFRFSLKVRDEKSALILSRRIDSEIDLLILGCRTGTISGEKLSESLAQLGVVKKKSADRTKTNFSDLFKRYVADRLSTGKWVEKTALENRRSFSLLILWAGNLSLEDIDHKLLLEYRDLLKQLPPNINTNPETRYKSLSEVIASKPARLLSISQVNKYLVTITAFFAWLHEHEYIKHNPAHHLLLPKSTRISSSEERSAYSATEISRIKSCLNNLRGELLASRPERYWVPMIALYSGMRLTEVSQLYHVDIAEIEGVMCFKINEEAPDKRLKNSGSVRIVPVHPELASLGFLDYCNEIASDRLFDKLTKEKFHGYGRQVSKWFTAFNRKHITQDPKKTFHSIRHSVANELKQLQVSGEVISELLGHKVESITMNRYGKRYRPDILLEAIKRLPW